MRVRPENDWPVGFALRASGSTLPAENVTLCGATAGESARGYISRGRPSSYLGTATRYTPTGAFTFLSRACASSAILAGTLFHIWS